MFLIHLHEWAAAVPAIDLPDPQPKAPPGASAGITAILAFAKWACLIVAVVALVAFGGRLAWEMSNRSRGVEVHAGGLAFILIGIVIISASTSIVSFIYSA
ncbi:MAG: hypothetical protein V4479_11215 [Actinomycetota bacterium]